jgi:uncharacterized protein YndB with AHSA1/START domain
MEINILKIDKEFKAPIEKVWQAITNRDEMKNWYFTFDENFRLEIGQEFDWSSPDENGKIWVHKGKMLEIVENKKLVHTWEYPGYSGSSTLTWQLIALDAKTTKLTLNHEFIIPFDSNIAALNISNFEAGWDSIVNGSLKGYLEG